MTILPKTCSTRVFSGRVHRTTAAASDTRHDDLGGWAGSLVLFLQCMQCSTLQRCNAGTHFMAAGTFPVRFVLQGLAWPSADHSAVCGAALARDAEAGLHTGVSQLLCRVRIVDTPRTGWVVVMSGHVFGPVPSRRLGRSLGVDLVPFKTCTYDCIYCQLGRTTNKTVERRQWVPLELVLEELEKKLDSRPDYITLSGSGEPTLFTPLDKLIEGIRSLTDIPIAVLTNGSLLGSGEVRRELAGADLVIPSLDAGNEVAFRLVNRPHEALAFERLLAGLIAFRRRFRGAYTGWKCSSSAVTRRLNESWRTFAGVSSSSDPIECN